MNRTQTHDYKLASKGKRFLATLVETIIITVFVYILQSFTSIKILEIGIKGEFIYYGFVAVVIGSFYPQYLGNIGHAIFKLKVISSETGEDYNQQIAVKRVKEGIKGILNIICVVNTKLIN